MKTLSILALFTCISFSSCEKNNEFLIKNYEAMHFVRQGGDQIEFNIFLPVKNDPFNVVVSKYDFHDVSIQMAVYIDASNEHVLSALQNALQNPINIEGEFQQSDLLTGTWANIYFVSNGMEIEVTNIELRNVLLEVEQLVRDILELNNAFTINFLGK